MAIHVVRLGTERMAHEGLRVGTVRHPPRGVRKADLAARNFYDVWLPELAPSEEIIKIAQAAEDEQHWKRFEKRYRAEMRRPEKQRLLDLMAALSRQTNFSVGCYCADENRCHRSILRQLLADHGAQLS